MNEKGFFWCDKKNIKHFISHADFKKIKIKNNVRKLPNGAIIGAGTTIGMNSIIHCYVYVGRLCHIGPQCEILSSANLGRRCKIGKGTIIHPDCYISAGVNIGMNCVIDINTEIGCWSDIGSNCNISGVLPSLCFSKPSLTFNRSSVHMNPYAPGLVSVGAIVDNYFRFYQKSEDEWIEKGYTKESIQIILTTLKYFQSVEQYIFRL